MSLSRKMNECWLVYWCVMLIPVVTQNTPQHITTCSCRYKNETYDLSPLAMTNARPRFTFNRGDGYLYSYNPCLPFTLPNQKGSLKQDSCTKVAICYWSDLASNLYVAYGYQHQIQCVIKDGNLALRYKHSEGQGKALFSFVKLVCDPGQTDVKSAFKWIDGSTEPVFEVKHSLCCPRDTGHGRPSPSSKQNFLKDHWFWIAVGEAILLLFLVIVVVFNCVRTGKRIEPDNNHPDGDDAHEPLLNPPPVAHDDVIPDNLLAPPDGFDVEPPREDEPAVFPVPVPVPPPPPADVINNRDQDGEPPLDEGEPINEINDPDLGDQPLARPNGLREDVQPVLPEQDRSGVQGPPRSQAELRDPERLAEPDSSRPGSQNEPEDPGPQAVGGVSDDQGAHSIESIDEQEASPQKVPVERSATSDEDSMV